MPDTHLYFHKYIEIHHPVHEGGIYDDSNV